MKIILTSRAKQNYSDILDFLMSRWNSEIVNNFIDEVEKIMVILVQNPFAFEVYQENNLYRQGHIHKNISFFYCISDTEIVVHLFWNNLQDSKKLHKIL